MNIQKLLRNQQDLPAAGQKSMKRSPKSGVQAPRKASLVLPAWMRSIWGLIASLMGVYTLIYILWTFYHWGGEQNIPLISDVGCLPVSLFGAMVAWRVAAEKRLAPRFRSAWLVLGMALFFMFLGDLFWFYFEVLLQEAPYPSIADLFYLGYYPLVWFGLGLLPAKPLRREGRVKLFLDMAIVMVVTWLPIWLFLIKPAVSSADPDIASQLLLAAYPMGDLIMMSGLALLVLRRPDQANLRATSWIFAGLFLILLGDLFYSYQSLQGTYTSGSWVDSFWIAGYLLWAFAALRNLSLDEMKQKHHRVGQIVESFSAKLPLIFAALGCALILYASTASIQDQVAAQLIVLCAALLIALVVARQQVELLENRRLNLELHSLSDKLRSLSTESEQRSTEREREIGLTAQISNRLSRLSDLQSLLLDAVEIIREHFRLDYTQVYLLDSNRRYLVLRAGTGAVGKELLLREHRLPLSLASINGTAAVEKQAVIVGDTTQSSIFRPNPLLPGTRSEAAVPLMVGERVVGVLDMQDKTPNAFTTDRLPVLQAMAGQLAVAIENASLYEKAEKARQEVEALAKNLTRQGWQEYLNALDRPDSVGYTYDRVEVRPQSTPLLQTQEANDLLVPIALAGEQVGLFKFEGHEKWPESKVELVKAIAEQVAQRAENLRLLARSERYRNAAEQAARRLTQQGWEEYFSKLASQGTAFVYNQDAVTRWKPGGTSSLRPTATIALKVQGEGIGELTVVGLDDLEGEEAEMLETIGQQLSAHLENLRLYSSAKQELAERRRAEATLLKFQQALDRATDAVFMTDTQGVIMYVNPAFEKVYGYSCEEAVGNTPRIIKSGLMPHERYKEFWGALMSKQVIAGEIVNKGKNGRLIPIEGANTPILDDDGNIVGFLAVHRDISERKQAEEKLAKRAAELETVAMLSTTVTAISDPLKVMQTVVDLAKSAFGLYHAHIYELDQSIGALVLAAGAGEVGQKMVAQGWKIPLEPENSLVARAARTRQGIIINNVRADADFLPNPLLPETRAEMAIPIIAGTKVLGVLDVQADMVDRFTQEDVNIQTTLASQVAVALENARLFQRTQAALAETETLYAISSAAAHSLDLNDILHKSLEQLLATMGYEAGLVTMVDEATDKLYLAAEHELPQPLVSNLAANGLDGTLFDLVYRQRSAVSVEDFEQGAPVDVSGLMSLGLRSYLGVPVESKGKLLGTICVFGLSARQVQPSKIALLQATAQQIGVTIENARLFKQVQRQAEYEAMVNTISQKIQGTTTVESALQVAIRELGRALGAQRTSVHLNVAKTPGQPTTQPKKKEVAAPMMTVKGADEEPVRRNPNGSRTVRNTGAVRKRSKNGK